MPFIYFDMDASSSAAFHPLPPAIPPRRAAWYSWRRWGWNFLTLSLLAHVLFGLGAAYYIVAIIQAKPRQQFQPPGPKGPNAPTRAMEHKVQLAKKQSSMSAPVAAKRITTTSLSKVALPALPAMKLDAVVLPATMSGMGGTGAGLGGFGNGTGGGGGGGGGGLSLFGLRNRTGGSLVGHLYDLKQDKQRRPTNVTSDRYTQVVKQLELGGFNTAALSSYYQANATLYATEMFTPTINADEAPKAFGVDAEVQPRLWLAVYSGKVIPSESGTYRFVGYGDDVLAVNFNHRLVLDGGINSPSGLRSTVIHHYNFNGGDWYSTSGNGGLRESLPVTVEAGRSYDMQILIGEEPGGNSLFQVLIKKDGVTYQEDSGHNPILPVFRLVGSKLPEPSSNLPPFATEGPVWKAEVPPVAPGL